MVDVKSRAKFQEVKYLDGAITDPCLACLTFSALPSPSSFKQVAFPRSSLEGARGSGVARSGGGWVLVLGVREARRWGMELADPSRGVAWQSGRIS